MTLPVNFGMYPITPGDLLGRLEDFVRTNAQLSADNVFLSSADDKYHGERPPSDKFVVIFPESFPIWQSVVTGAGQSFAAAPGFENLGFDASVRITIFTRLNSDQEFRASELIRSDTLGILGTTINLIGAVQFWTPVVDGVPTACYLREPMRILDGPKLQPRNYRETMWSLVSTRFEMKFTTRMTTAPPTT